MHDNINNWLTEKLKVPGVVACGIRFADQQTVTSSNSTQYASVGLENACRCLSDTFHVLYANHFAMDFVRWTYENHFLYGAVRPDGRCLAVLTQRKSATLLQQNDFEQMLAEFQQLEN